MSSKNFDFTTEYNALRSKFNSKNYPELNKRISCYFFFYFIQENYPSIWKSLKIPWKIIEISQLNLAITVNKLPKQYNAQKLSAEIMGYLNDYETNGSPSMQFLPIVPLRHPSHPELWKSYIDDTSSDKLLQIFEKFINIYTTEANTGNVNIQEDINFRKSLSNYK